MVWARDIPIDENANAMKMAQTIFGDGVKVVGASYEGDDRSSGIYSDGNAVSPGVTPGDTGVILSTGRAGDFTNWWGDPNRSDSTSTNTKGVDNDPDFNAAAGARTYDASILNVDFIPDGDTMTMQFVFASEEYPEFTNSIYQDFVGVWVNGTQVEMSIGGTDPGNINGGSNENLFISNSGDTYNTEMDGFTVTMTMTLPVNPGELNSITLGIADVADTSYDSNLLIAGGSVQTALIAQDDSTHLTGDATKTIDILGNDESASGGTLSVTHINGQAVNAGDTVTLKTGQTVTLNSDGTITLVGDGTDEDFNFTYAIDDGTNSDTGVITVSSVPCFVAGTMIRTPGGEVPVETLSPGDLVKTMDNGPQPIRWIGRRCVPAEGDFAPIRIAANTIGRHRELLVSPLHRVLVRDALAELLFGAREVLVAARDLVNDLSVRRVPGGMVEYFHILFDAHQIVFSEGLRTESFLPGPQIAENFEAEIVEEICTLFPELDPDSGDGYGSAVRPALRRYEVELLLGRARVA